MIQRNFLCWSRTIFSHTVSAVRALVGFIWVIEKHFTYIRPKKSTVCKKIVRDQQGKFLWIKTSNWQENYFQPKKIGLGDRNIEDYTSGLKEILLPIIGFDPDKFPLLVSNNFFTYCTCPIEV